MGIQKPGEDVESGLVSTPASRPILNPHADRPDFLSALLNSVNENSGLSPEMQSILLMQEFALDETEIRQEYTAELAEIMSMEPSAAFKALDSLMQRAVSTKLTTYIQETLETRVPGGHPAFTAERAAHSNSKSLVGLETRSPANATWLQIFGHVNDVKYALLGSYLEGSAAQEQMHPVARLEYVHFREIAAAVNELSLVWTQDSGTLMNTQERSDAGFLNEVAAIRVDEVNLGTFKEVPWVQAYPMEIQAVVSAYRGLADELHAKAESMVGEEKRLYESKSTYYEAVAAAYESSTKEAFLKADTLLPGQSLFRSDHPQHTSTIETGYGEDAVQRIPEAALWYPDAETKEVNEAAILLREDMARELAKMLTEDDFGEGVGQTVDLVRKTSFMGAHAMGAGLHLYFKPAGQFLPNEAEARFNGGVTVTADLTTAIEREPEFEEAYQVIFGTALEQTDVKKKMVRSTGAHEFGHPVGLTQSVNGIPGTYERIPRDLVNTFPEEWKATVGGLVLGAWRLYKSPEAKTEVSMDDLKQLLLERTAGAGRYAKKRKSPTAQPYTRKSIMLMKVIFEEGLLDQGEEGWSMDVSDEAKVMAVYQRLEQDYKDLLKIYGKGTKEDLEQFLTDRLQPCPATEHIFNSMDASFPGGTNKGAMTLEQICALPN